MKTRPVSGKERGDELTRGELLRKKHREFLGKRRTRSDGKSKSLSIANENSSSSACLLSLWPMTNGIAKVFDATKLFSFIYIFHFAFFSCLCAIASCGRYSHVSFFFLGPYTASHSANDCFENNIFGYNMISK